MSDFDVVVNGGLWFDGTGSAPRRRNLGIRDGVVVRASIRPLPVGPDTEIIDAGGKWVVPGFVDVHTHYDAEVLVSPGLPESVRHGVTTVVLGNCSLSTVYSTPRECADLFSRVEAVPHDSVLRILDENKIWQSPAEYVEALESLPLGPNIAGFIGHSDIRTHVLGLGRGTDKRTKPSTRELERMGAMLTEAVDAGFLGLSSMTNALDKIDGDEYRSRSLPSTYARWKEFRFLNRILRDRGKILQSAPTINLHPNIAGFFAESSGLGRRKPLKTSLLSAADSKAYPPIVYFMLAAAPLLNRFAKTDFKWQHLPVPFTVYADGIDLVVFEEFGAGAAALHLKDQVERNALLQDESYRRRFRKDYDNKFSPRIWHRNFYDAVIVGCPDEALIGKTFGAVGDLRGVHPVDAYLDLVVKYGTDLRWRTTIANHRPKFAKKLAASSGVQMGFGDAGAHLRNMAFYNYPIRLLKKVKDAQSDRTPFLSVERAVHRLTGELADWYGIDAGHLREGDRADLVVIDPAGLDATVDGLFEAEVPEYGGLRRMVNRSDAAAVATVINGRLVYRDGEFTGGFGVTKTGRFLRAGASAADHSERETAVR
ncbi:N-acyl-D-amino-acid deacylase family protein [Rhodococcus opacus]|uniref:Amidohydrolase family protein n=1 Tax=Rhodococcus opacus TaxID=37919 RepID=A0AAX3YBU5_RHOOP|nr:amidohydrolase family protein [Rhodococcus opacus]ELB90335.1 N-acyl-D-glutamate deacylase [Rhodococcus wratislaviensis IFP 2016]MCZ4583255.1 amidohydrolase family protein [Rhodococcus opacus]MDX5966221.1 amidohydrolase family protein [Rhodococcus opacus]NKY76227.1 amidohydrolase family protein [Rhodococcus opacus]QZS57748.1 amidohydrolase family protein [Rhodococcus opacus]